MASSLIHLDQSLPQPAQDHPPISIHIPVGNNQFTRRIDCPETGRDVHLHNARHAMQIDYVISSDYAGEKQAYLASVPKESNQDVRISPPTLHTHTYPLLPLSRKFLLSYSNRHRETPRLVSPLHPTYTSMPSSPSINRFFLVATLTERHDCRRACVNVCLRGSHWPGR